MNDTWLCICGAKNSGSACPNCSRPFESAQQAIKDPTREFIENNAATRTGIQRRIDIKNMRGLQLLLFLVAVGFLITLLVNTLVAALPGNR